MRFEFRARWKRIEPPTTIENKLRAILLAASGDSAFTPNISVTMRNGQYEIFGVTESPSILMLKEALDTAARGISIDPRAGATPPAAQ